MATKRLSFTSTNIYYHFIIETRRNAFQNIVEAARHTNIIVVSARVLNNSTKMFSNTQQKIEGVFFLCTTKWQNYVWGWKQLRQKIPNNIVTGFLEIFLHQRLIGLECLVIFFVLKVFFTRQLFFTRQSLFCGPVFFSDYFNSNSSVNINFWITVIWQFNNQNN